MVSGTRLVMGMAVLAAAGLAGCAVNSTDGAAKSAATSANAVNVPAKAPVVQEKPIQVKEGGRYLFEDKIEPGMTGYGLTVMSGGKIDRFQFTVIDVVKDFSPATNAILVRCSGLGLEHSGIIAGMSGSPCYIDGKMIGAIAFGWGMAKDPIAGVEPIRQMLSINPEVGKGAPAAAMNGGMGDPLLLREAAGAPGWRRLTASLEQRAGGMNLTTASGRSGEAANSEGMHPLVSPLMVSGLSASSMALLREGLEGTGLVPMASGSGSGDGNGKPLGGIAELKPGEIHLEPGSSIAVPLLTGDFDMSAIGTVTEVRDGKVYAFGHAFQAQGVTRLPIDTAYIYTIMPNLDQSFKMGTSLHPAGTLVMDEQTGIVGVLGKAPPTVPVTITVKNGLLPPRVYRYQLSPHPKFTPIILSAVLNESLAAQRKLPPQYTVRVNGEVTFDSSDGSGPLAVQIHNVGSTDAFHPEMTLLPVLVLADNPFQRLKITGLNLEATVEPVNRGAVVRSVTVDRMTVAPGDEIHAVVDVERFRSDIERVPVSVRVPADVPDGDYELMVGSSAMALEQEADYAPQRFDPQNIDALESAVRDIEGYSADQIYARLVLGISGASVDGRERNDLPPSRVAIYASDRRTDAAPLMRVVTQKTDAGAVVENGGQVFIIHVNHKADERYFSPRANAAAGNGINGGDQTQRGKLLDQPPPPSGPDDGD